MNQYTPEQIHNLILVIVSSPCYSGHVVNMLLKKTRSSKEVTGYCTDGKAILDNMRAFWRTKIGRNYPSKELKRKMKKIRDIIFYVEDIKLPLYLNDPITKPIAAWRLQNNL
jgi:hypothetical protein